MNNIIHQICENYISEVLHFFDSGAIRKLDEIEVVLKEKTNSYLKQMTQTYFEEIDQAIADDKTGGRS